MSEREGINCCGLYWHDDPALTTTTENFKFQYTQPEKLARVIQKVQQKDCVNTNQNSLLSKYCKGINIQKEANAAVLSTDCDIGTCISTKMRDSAHIEDDKLVDKANSGLKSVAKYQTIEKAHSTEIGEDKSDTSSFHDTKVNLKFPNTRNNVCNERVLPVHTDHVKKVDYQNSQNSQVLENPLEVQKKCDLTVPDVEYIKPSWVNIEIPNTELLYLMDDKKINETSIKLTDRTAALAVDQTPFTLDSQVHTSDRTNLDYVTGCGNDTTYNEDNLQGFSCYEDSDLEHEIKEINDYKKYYHTQPKLKDTMHSAIESSGCTEFVNINPEITSIDLTNDSPIQYTDLINGIPRKLLHENGQVILNSRNIYIKPHKRQNISNIESLLSKHSSFHEQHLDDSLCRPLPCSKRTQNSVLHSSCQCNEIDVPLPDLKPYSLPTTYSYSAHSNGKVQNKLDEQLQENETEFFPKIAAIQQSIIEALEILRINLLEIYAAERNCEKVRCKKFVSEFSEYFSRNLYTVKIMIDELKVMPIMQLNRFNMINVAIRVSAIFTLILQALRTHYKLLHTFVLDEDPEMLAALIEMIYSSTTVCLEKGVFDRRDTIIGSLQDRCTKFLGSLEYVHHCRLLTTRNSCTKTRNKHARSYVPKRQLNPRTSVPVPEYNQNTKCRFPLKYLRNHKTPNITSRADISDDKVRLVSVPDLKSVGTAFKKEKHCEAVNIGGADLRLQSRRRLNPKQNKTQSKVVVAKVNDKASTSLNAIQTEKLLQQKMYKAPKYTSSEAEGDDDECKPKQNKTYNNNKDDIVDYAMDVAAAGSEESRRYTHGFEGCGEAFNKNKLNRIMGSKNQSQEKLLQKRSKDFQQQKQQQLKWEKQLESKQNGLQMSSASASTQRRYKSARVPKLRNPSNGAAVTVKPDETIRKPSQHSRLSKTTNKSGNHLLSPPPEHSALSTSPARTCKGEAMMGGSEMTEGALNGLFKALSANNEKTAHDEESCTVNTQVQNRMKMSALVNTFNKELITLIHSCINISKDHDVTVIDKSENCLPIEESGVSISGQSLNSKEVFANHSVCPQNRTEKYLHQIILKQQTAKLPNERQKAPLSQSLKANPIVQESSATISCSTNNNPSITKTNVENNENIYIDKITPRGGDFLKSSLYTNSNDNEPWRVFSRIANKLSQGILHSIEEDFTNSVSKYVQEALELEIQA